MSNQREESQRRVGEKIRSWREFNGVTQAQLADRMSDAMGTRVHKSAVSKIEAGQRGVSLEEASVICSALTLPVSELTAAYRPEDTYELWDHVREGFRNFAKRMDSTEEEMQVLHGQTQALASNLASPEAVIPETYEPEVIRAGVDEMLDFIDQVLPTCFAFSEISSTYGRLEGLSDLSADYVLKSRADELDAHLGERIREIKNRDRDTKEMLKAEGRTFGDD